MATSIDSYRGRNWTDRLSAFASLYSVVSTLGCYMALLLEFSSLHQKAYIASVFFP